MGATHVIGKWNELEPCVWIAPSYFCEGIREVTSCFGGEHIRRPKKKREGLLVTHYFNGVNHFFPILSLELSANTNSLFGCEIVSFKNIP